VLRGFAGGLAGGGVRGRWPPKPADVGFCLWMAGEVATEHSQKSAGMFAAAPVLELASIQGKYGVWKDTLLASWRRSRRGKTCKQGQLSAAAVWQVLRAAALAMHAVRTASESLHVGRGVAHHSGFLPMLLRMGAISKRKSPGASAVNLGSGQRVYFVAPRFPGPGSRVLGHLPAMIQASARVFAPRPPPRTLHQWRTQCIEMLEAVKAIRDRQTGHTKTGQMRSSAALIVNMSTGCVDGLASHSPQHQQQPPALPKAGRQLLF
jgi:hypothetical protein